MTEKIIIGSRGSQLALMQSNYIKSLLIDEYPGLTVDIKVIHTKGDLNLDKSYKVLGGKGIFTYELERSLLNDKIDLAVHSLKDLPTILKPGLRYLGSPKREDARDVFISKKYSSLITVPNKGVIATGSIRRKAQISGLRTDIEVVDVRGNIDTRLNKLDQSNWDGMVLAAAGIHRLNLSNLITEYLDYKIHVPAPCQGSLGIEIASHRNDIIDILKPIINEQATFISKIERIFLRSLGGDCTIPVGSYARIDGKNIKIIGYISNMEGTSQAVEQINGDISIAESLSKRLATILLDQINFGK